MRVSPDRQAEETGEQCVRPAAYNDAVERKQQASRLGCRRESASLARECLP